MKLSKVNVTNTIEEVSSLLEKEKRISPVLKAAIQLLLTIVTLFAERLSLNSSNSSKPPSTDPNRKKKKKAGNKRKPGDQPGRDGTNLEPIDNPDDIISIKLDKRTLPRGEYHDVGFEARQVIELEISRIVTEYRAQVLENAAGKRFVADVVDKTEENCLDEVLATAYRQRYREIIGMGEGQMPLPPPDLNKLKKKVARKKPKNIIYWSGCEILRTIHYDLWS